MRIVIVGAGSIGAYYGARLIRRGHDVTFVARGESLRAMADEGVRVETPDGLLEVRPRVSSLEALEAGVFDLALVTTKWDQLVEVARPTGRALRPGGVAVPLLNGLDSEDVLAAHLGADRVVGGVAFISAGRLGPTRFYCHQASFVLLAPLPGGDEARVRELVAVLAESFPCRASSDLRSVLWSKMLWNGPFNAICALTDLTAGEVLAIPSLEALVRSAMWEVIAVAAAEGVTLDPAEIERLIELTRGPAAPTEPSMLQDLRAGRPTEVDTIQGAVVARGARHGIATPVHASLQGLLHGREQAVRQRRRPAMS